MIRTISYAALALFLISAPASVLAQNAPANDPAGQPPATMLPDATAAPDAVAKENPPKPVEGQIILQDKSTLLASAIIGSSVYSPSDESMGDVNDLVIKPTGEIEAVVVGVGGFIGIGEKERGDCTRSLRHGADRGSCKHQNGSERDEGRAASSACFQIRLYPEA
jgi:hypothetical protein